MTIDRIIVAGASAGGVESEGPRVAGSQGVGIAIGGDAFEKGIMGVGKLSPFACPVCHGVPAEIEKDDEWPVPANCCHRPYTLPPYTPRMRFPASVQAIDAGRVHRSWR